MASREAGPRALYSSLARRQYLYLASSGHNAVRLSILQSSGRVVVVEARCYLRAGFWTVEQLLSESSHGYCDDERRCILDMACMTMQRFNGMDMTVRSTDLFSTQSESARHARLTVDRDMGTRKLV